MKILVVDDEKDVISLFRQRFRRELRTGSIALAFAGSGEAALHQLSGQTDAEIILILSDINMPGMNGLELLRMLKTSHPQRPVVMVTAYDNAENRRIAARYAADGYLTKPLDFDRLRELIAHLTAVGLNVDH